MDERLKGLYGITNQEMLLDNQALFKHVEEALKGGMILLQYRNKQSPRLQSHDDLIQLKQLCHRYHALLIINDDVTLCLEVGADGVHLGKNDHSLISARKQLGKGAIIGVSCYNDLALAKQASEQGASYIAFGAFFNSPTKPNAPTASLELIQQVKHLNIPICCIGGITTDNAPPLIQQGADMLAVITELFSLSQIQLKASKFTHLF